MKRLIIPLAVLGLMAVSTAAISHPHDDEPATKSATKPESKVERIWPNFGKKSDNQKSDKTSDDKTPSKLKITTSKKTSDEVMEPSDFTSRLEKRFQRHADDMSRRFDRAEAKNKFLKDGDIDSVDDIRDAARAFEDLIADSGIISGLADMMVELVEDFEVESSDEGLALNFEGKRLGRLKIDQDKEESIALEGFGRNLSIDKKVIRKNGKTKTRIIIEVDGDEEFDIDITPPE